MNIEKYLDEKKKIQENFLEFIESVENIEENFKNLENQFEDMKIRDNKHELRLFLHFISSICDNYCRNSTFFDKIERILKLFKDNIKKHYSNSDIFNIFQNNKRILLFLIKEKIIIFDEFLAKKIVKNEFSKNNYAQYLALEIKPFVNEKWFPKNELAKEFGKELPDDFNSMCDKGENENFICKLIREDLIDDFIEYFNEKSVSLDATIKRSIFETNPFLLEKQIDGIKIIEYAAFFGSIQIFTFLKNAKAKLTPSLWLYAIHGRNIELIHLLEKHHIEQTNKEDEEKLFNECLKESIKCHHNDIAEYFIKNHIQNKDGNSKDTFIQSLKYYNFSFVQNECVNESLFCDLCHFDYCSLVSDLLARRVVDVNSKIIQNHIIQ